MTSLTDTLIQRQQAKYSMDQFAPRTPTLADTGARFTASNNQGMISQGIGNFLGALNAPAARQEALRQEAIRAEQTQYDRGRDLFADQFKVDNLQRKDAAAARGQAQINTQNQFQIDTDNILQKYVRPISDKTETNRQLLNQLPDSAYDVVDGAISLNSNATARDREIFSKLNNTPTSYSDKDLRKEGNALYDAYRKEAKAQGIPLTQSRNDFITQLQSAARDSINRVTSMSATEEDDLNRRSQELSANMQQQEALVDAETNFLTSGKRADIESYQRLDDAGKQAFLAQSVLPYAGAYNNEVQAMQSTLDQIQTSGIKTVEDLLTTYVTEQDDAKDILKSGGEYLRAGLKQYNDTVTGQTRLDIDRNAIAGIPNLGSSSAPQRDATGTSKLADINDPLVLAAADRAAKIVGLDRDWQILGNDADFNSSLQTQFVKELGKLDAFRKAQEKKAKIRKDFAQAQSKQILRDTARTTGVLRKTN